MDCTSVGIRGRGGLADACAPRVMCRTNRTQTSSRTGCRGQDQYLDRYLSAGPFERVERGFFWLADEPRREDRESGEFKASVPLIEPDSIQGATKTKTCTIRNGEHFYITNTNQGGIALGHTELILVLRVVCLDCGFVTSSVDHAGLIAIRQKASSQGIEYREYPGQAKTHGGVNSPCQKSLSERHVSALEGCFDRQVQRHEVLLNPAAYRNRASNARSPRLLTDPLLDFVWFDRRLSALWRSSRTISASAEEWFPG